MFYDFNYDFLRRTLRTGVVTPLSFDSYAVGKPGTIGRAKAVMLVVRPEGAPPLGRVQPHDPRPPEGAALMARQWVVPHLVDFDPQLREAFLTVESYVANLDESIGRGGGIYWWDGNGDPNSVTISYARGGDFFIDRITGDLYRMVAEPYTRTSTAIAGENGVTGLRRGVDVVGRDRGPGPAPAAAADPGLLAQHDLV